MLQIRLNHLAFYIQNHYVPLDHMTQDNAILIGKALKNLLEVEEDSQFGSNWRLISPLHFNKVLPFLKTTTSMLSNMKDCQIFIILGKD